MPKPLAYIHTRRDRWVVTCVADTTRRFSVDSFHEARDMARDVGWDAVRFKPWDT